MAEENRKKRRKMRNENKEKEKFIKDGSALIRTAIEAGFTTRSKIANATGMKLHDITKVFEEDRDLWALYTIRRRSIFDIATDNIEDIIMDKNHPQHYQASMHIVKTYKGDLDKGILEKQDDNGIALDIKGSGKSTAPKVQISFSK